MKIKKHLILKIIISFLLVIATFAVLENIYTNFIYYNKFETAIVFKTELLSSGTMSSPDYHNHIYVKKGNNIYVGEYSIERSNFNIKVRDTVSYRRNNLRNHIWIIKKNGLTIQKYLGPSEYFSIFYLLMIPVLIFTRPRIIRYLKQKEAERVSEIITNS